MKRILFVSGFAQGTRAKDLAAEFEKYGELIRCDIPMPRGNPNATPYAFIEFKSSRDAEDAYSEMHEVKIEGYRISVQWAKNPPSAIWRNGPPGPPGPPPPRRSSRSPRRDDRRRRSRSRSPRRDSPRDRDGYRERRRSRSRDRHHRDRDREYQHRDHRDRDRRPRSASPDRDRRRSDKGNKDRARTPPYPPARDGDIVEQNGQAKEPDAAVERVRTPPLPVEEES